MPNKLCKPIKKALANEYGYRNVSVKNGTGTAWGWVEIQVTKPHPETFNFHSCDGGYNCYECRQNGYLRADDRRTIEQKAIDALKALDLKPYTYTDDMGYDRTEMLVSVNYEGGNQ